MVNAISEFDVAERVGFEPTVHCCITSFQDWLLKPLGHLSVRNQLYYYNIKTHLCQALNEKNLKCSLFCVIIDKDQYKVVIVLENCSKEDKRIFILSREKPAKAVISLGVPLIAGMFIMVLYNLVDTYFIGLMNDDYRLAAVNLAYPVMMITVAVSNTVGAGASSLIARSLGAGDTERANVQSSRMEEAEAGAGIYSPEIAKIDELLKR